jgi:hypothetical protein
MSNEVTYMALPEIKFVGIPVVSTFQHHLPERIEETKRSFLERRQEFKNVIKPERYYCPHFSSEALFT